MNLFTKEAIEEVVGRAQDKRAAILKLLSTKDRVIKACKPGALIGTLEGFAWLEQRLNEETEQCGKPSPKLNAN